MSSAIFLFSLWSCFILLDRVEGNFFSDFFDPGISHGPSFSGNQLYVVDVGVDHLKGTIECFGDFNSDKYTDMFVISDDRSTIDVYLWEHDDWSFKHLETAKITDSHNITNLAAGDFNYDGKLDLLVTGNSSSSNTTYIQIYIGDHDKFVSTISVSESDAAQVLVFDQNADLKLDLFGSHEKKRTVWNNKGDGHFDLSSQIIPDILSNSYIPSPNSNAFVDMNGDCLSDLIVTSCNSTLDETCHLQVEIWLNQKGHYSFHKVFPLPPGAGQLVFSDFDGDGTMDILFPTCYPAPNCTEDNSLYVIYNVQMGLCKYDWSKSDDCRPASALCKDDPNFQLDFTSLYQNNSDTSGYVRVSTSQFGDRHFLLHPEFQSLAVRVGDYNLDGYPDLIVPLVSPSTNATIVELWESVKCTAALCGAGAAGKNRRTFSRVTKGVDALNDIQNAYAGAFFDLDEDGKLDMLILTDPSLGTSKANEINRGVRAIYNNYFNDAFFLKTMALNGVCTAWCSEGPKFPSPKPYGVNFPGATFKYTSTDLGGNQHVIQGVQLQQSGYQALQTPYILFGLGRTSNYIEQIFMGLSVDQKDHFSSWICIIPNSQLLAIPYRPTHPEEWSLELYIKSSGLTLWIVVAIVSCLMIIGGVIFFLKYKEKRQDELQKRETAHLFSFDAL